MKLLFPKIQDTSFYKDVVLDLLRQKLFINQLKLNPCNFQIQNPFLLSQLTMIIKSSSTTMYETDVGFTIYCTDYEFFLRTSYKLLFIAQVTSKFLRMSYELLLIVHVANPMLTVYIFSTASAIHLYDLFLIKSSIPSTLLLCNILWMSASTSNYNLTWCVKFICNSMTYCLQNYTEQNWHSYWKVGFSMLNEY